VNLLPPTRQVLSRNRKLENSTWTVTAFIKYLAVFCLTTTTTGIPRSFPQAKRMIHGGRRGGLPGHAQNGDTGWLYERIKSVLVVTAGGDSQLKVADAIRPTWPRVILSLVPAFSWIVGLFFYSFSHCGWAAKTNCPAYSPTGIVLSYLLSWPIRVAACEVRRVLACWELQSVRSRICASLAVLLLPGVHCRLPFLASTKRVIRLDESESMNLGQCVWPAPISLGCVVAKPVRFFPVLGMADYQALTSL
jgi:hypothetical protein